MKADAYAYRDRRNRKRDFRRLWITRINAAARINGMSYSQFMHGLSVAGVEVDRKILADIAVRDAETFRRFVDVAREASATYIARRRSRQTDIDSLPGVAPERDGALFVSPTTPNETRKRRSETKMSRIASTQNPRLKALRRLAGKRERARRGLFVAEGEDLIGAAQLAGRRALEGYRLEGSALGGSAFQDVGAEALASVSTLGSGTRVLAVYEQHWEKPVGPLCVYLHGVADPGNVGTVVRSAHAFGASCVALGPGCADPHSPKAVRASMGAIFAIGLARVDSPGELPGERIALVASAPEPLEQAASGGARPITLLVGAEREGLPDEVLQACERVPGSTIASESLNAAMAATMALYEMTRRPSRVPPA